MRHGSFQNRSQNRNRHRGGQGGGGQNRSNNNGGSHRPHRNQVLDSNGPEVRVRGTAFQINEKYMALAKDATSSGDLILAENYLQHAEHYQRMINEFEPQFTNQQQPSYDNGDETADDDAAEEGEVTSTKKPVSVTVSDSEEGEEGGARMVRRQPRRRAPSSEDEDLGLPTSILGAGEAANA